MRANYGVPQPIDPAIYERSRQEQEAAQAALMPITAPASVIRELLYPTPSKANFAQSVTIPTFLAGVGYGLIAGMAIGAFVARR